MLKRLYIDNFRCFVNFEYKPERKQLLLGANGSGKSSLLDAVRAVQGFVREDGLDPLFKSSKTMWLNLPKQIFEVEAELGGRQYRYRLEIKAEASALDRVLAESLTVDGGPVIENSDGYITLHPANSSEAVMRVRTDDRHSSMLGGLRGFRDEARTFVEWLSNDLICLRINPYAMQDLGRQTLRAHPAFDMGDIADWYKRLLGNDFEGVLHLRNSLKEVFESFATLNFKDLQPGIGELNAEFKRPEGGLSFKLTELSDGQRCLIALYMILQFLIAKGHTVFLDEPDNFISLREIQPWLLSAEEAVDDHKGQLILISHHPEILNQWAKDFGLLFTREENGHVRTKPFSAVNDTGLEPAETIARGWEDE